MEAAASITLNNTGHIYKGINKINKNCYTDCYTCLRGAASLESALFIVLSRGHRQLACLASGAALAAGNKSAWPANIDALRFLPSISTALLLLPGGFISMRTHSRHLFV